MAGAVVSVFVNLRNGGNLKNGLLTGAVVPQLLHDACLRLHPASGLFFLFVITLKPRGE